MNALYSPGLNLLIFLEEFSKFLKSNTLDSSISSGRAYQISPKAFSKVLREVISE